MPGLAVGGGRGPGWCLASYSPAPVPEFLFQSSSADNLDHLDSDPRRDQESSVNVMLIHNITSWILEPVFSVWISDHQRQPLENLDLNKVDTNRLISCTIDFV